METETPRKALRNLHLDNVARISSPLKIPPSPFMKNLGCGTGVNVYRLERSPEMGVVRSPWAVKRISQKTREIGRNVFNSRILDEAEILRQLCHPNIIGYRGLSKDSNGVDSLVLECMQTSLGELLEGRNENDKGPLPTDHTKRFIIDIAKALDYLHTEAKLLHGDLKSYNILIKGDFEICKLCDFGVSLPLDENGLIDFNKNPSLEYVGTDIWSAPEIVDKESIIDSKADIFSFGLVIYETIALIPPHTWNLRLEDDDSEMSENSIENISFDASAIAIGTRPPLPQAFKLSPDYNVIVELFYCCTNDAGEDRPTANLIWNSFVNI